MENFHTFLFNSAAKSLLIVLCVMQIIILLGNCTSEFDVSSPYKGLYNMHELQIDPQNGNILYAAYHVGLYKSTNGGDSWEEILDECVNAVAINQVYPDTIYAIGEHLLSKSTNAGESWQPFSIPFLYLIQVVVYWYWILWMIKRCMQEIMKDYTEARMRVSAGQLSGLKRIEEIY